MAYYGCSGAIIIDVVVNYIIALASIAVSRLWTEDSNSYVLFNNLPMWRCPVESNAMNGVQNKGSQSHTHTHRKYCKWYPIVVMSLASSLQRQSAVTFAYNGSGTAQRWRIPNGYFYQFKCNFVVGPDIFHRGTRDRSRIWRATGLLRSQNMPVHQTGKSASNRVTISREVERHDVSATATAGAAPGIRLMAFFFYLSLSLSFSLHRFSAYNLTL